MKYLALLIPWCVTSYFWYQTHQHSELKSKHINDLNAYADALERELETLQQRSARLGKEVDDLLLEYEEICPNYYEWVLEFERMEYLIYAHCEADLKNTRAELDQTQTDLFFCYQDMAVCIRG